MTGSHFRLALAALAVGLALAATAAAQTPLPPPAFGNAETRQDRIEELEGQLREATQENERLQRQLNEAQREIRRLGALVGEMASVNQTLQTPPPAPGGGVPSATPPAQAPAPAPGPAAQTGALGTLPVAQLPGTEAQAYSYARQLIVDGRLAEAEAAFAQFLQAYPNAETSADARYWFAYTQLARNNHRDAAQNFIQYLRVAPQGPRAPEAQVRLGMALAGLARDGSNDAAELRQACGAFASLARQYPNAARHVRDLAQREARAANCAA
jgi:TolA-binding protein